MNIYGLSEKGLVRKDNQDSIYYDKNTHQEYLAIVCDGIGGGNAGDVASHIACNSLADAFLQKPATHNDKDTRKWITEVVKQANDDIFTQSTKSRNLKGMGTTVAGVFMNARYTYIFHCGDSRVYALYNELISLTEDHNLAADLMKAGDLKDRDVALHPKATTLTNALGIWNNVRVEIHKIREDYQTLLICSDGLHGFVSEQKICDILKSKDTIEKQTEELRDASLLVGGFDNVSIILIKRGIKK
ncbi:MAG: PP2C family protein-serine/threonine phosphatase [Breznakia sp.]